MLELVIGNRSYYYLWDRFGIIGMIICVVMQYLHTGLLSNQNADESNLYVWIIPPIIIIIGLIIGIVHSSQFGDNV